MLTFYFFSIWSAKTMPFLLSLTVFSMEKVYLFLLLVGLVKGDVSHGMFTNRNYQVPWNGPPVYNHTTTTTTRPEAVIELTFNPEQLTTTTTTATPPEKDATTKEDGTIDFKVPGKESFLFVFVFNHLHSFLLQVLCKVKMFYHV